MVKLDVWTGRALVLLVSRNVGRDCAKLGQKAIAQVINKFSVLVVPRQSQFCMRLRADDQRFCPIDLWILVYGVSSWIHRLTLPRQKVTRRCYIRSSCHSSEGLYLTTIGTRLSTLDRQLDCPASSGHSVGANPTSIGYLPRPWLECIPVLSCHSRDS
jgi:hypothetical protein